MEQKWRILDMDGKIASGQPFLFRQNFLAAIKRLTFQEEP